MKPVHTYVFDAYGTLFDVHSAVARHRDAVGPQADRLSEIWRQKQLEYTWVLSLMGAYQGFDMLTERSLDFAAARCGGISGATRTLLLDAYQTLDAFADVVPTLQKLKARGCVTAILSNGTPSMLASAVRSAGLADLLDASLSVDAAKVFKTAPQAYELVEKTLNVPREQISFQSSNRWDIAGAQRHGFQTAWINRSHAPEEYPEFAPDRVLGGLAGLVD